MTRALLTLNLLSMLAIGATNGSTLLAAMSPYRAGAPALPKSDPKPEVKPAAKPVAKRVASAVPAANAPRIFVTSSACRTPLLEAE